MFVARSRQARPTFALDDTPTERYGRHVQGAGVHHNPTPGPAGSPFVYGHVWVVLGLLAAHPLWGMIALPLLARLYVRKKDVGGIDKKHRPEFRTKLEMAVAQLDWAESWASPHFEQLWVVADGAYAKRPFLKGARQYGFTVVSRLRKDAALWSLPEPVKAGQKRDPALPACVGDPRAEELYVAADSWSLIDITERLQNAGVDIEKTFELLNGFGRHHLS